MIGQLLRCTVNINARCFVLLILSLASFSVFSIQPTSQQIDQFKRMSPAEQSRIAKQFGVSIPQYGVSAKEIVVQETTVLPMDVMLDDYSGEQGGIASVGDQVDKQSRLIGLKPFGYELFAGEPTTFTPINDIPVSSSYILGPGDSLKVNLYGKESQFFELAIDQEGMVYPPDLGPLSLAGLSFSEAKNKLINIIDQKMIGVKASVSMGQLRSIRVFVLGEARKPGSYVVSSLSTITNALVLSGGVSVNGSLRNVQLKRRGDVIQTLDLYDLLLSGNSSRDAQLKSGDVVFIPPVGLTVGISGEVRRPAIYEIRKDDTAGRLIKLAGGLLSTANSKFSKVERIGSADKKLLLGVDFSLLASSFKLKDGDRINIPATLGLLEGVVTVTGEVLRPGTQHWIKGDRLLDIVDLVGITPNTDMQYGLLKRYPVLGGKLKLLPFSISQILNAPASKQNYLLQDGDELIFFGSYKSNRDGIIGDLISEIRSRADVRTPSQEVKVSGNVRHPGVYPLVEGMIVEDLIHAAGGLNERAFKLRAELSRIEFNDKQERLQSRIDLDLSVLKSLDYVLKSRDVLQVKTIPDWSKSEQVILRGEVKFPGAYPIYKNDTLSILLERAGGLTEYAYAPGAVFTREELKKQQTQQLEDMQKRLAEDIAKAKLTAINQRGEVEGDKTGGVGEAQKLLSQLKGTSATGRLVIDLEKMLSKESDYTVPLRKGDTIFIPTKKNSVTIVGEVQLPISQIYETQLGYWDYIERSGGTTDKADEDRVYVIKANGGVQMPDTSSWFSSEQQQISPGDTIVVPLDADKLDQIVLWRDVSQIFYQIALGAAAVGSL